MRYLKRRKFIKTTTAASIALTAIPFTGCFLKIKEKEFSLSQTILLKYFDNEQEGNPCIITDAEGLMWMYTFRRMSYPKNTKMVSTFHFDGNTWEETIPITIKSGQYETPSSACAINGKPDVDWTGIEGANCNINVVTGRTKRFTGRYTWM